MNTPKTPAPLGKCAKSPGGARNPHQADLREVAKYVSALRHRVENQHRHCVRFVETTATVIRELKCDVKAVCVREALHEMEAHARLMRRSSGQDVEILLKSIRARITCSTKHERPVVGFWKALWISCYLYPSPVELALLADTIDAVVSAIRTATGLFVVSDERKKGGLTAQRWAWADADR